MEAACKELAETVCTCIIYEHINLIDKQIFMAKMMARCNDGTGELYWNINNLIHDFRGFMITSIYISSRKLTL